MPQFIVVRASRVKVLLPRLAQALPSLPPCARAALHTMCLLVTAQRACAALLLSGRLLAVVLLLDTVYFACVYETAVLPRTFDGDNISDAVNVSLVPPSSSSSLSSAVPSSPVSSSQSSSSSASSSASSAGSKPLTASLLSPTHVQDVEEGGNASLNNLTLKEPHSADNVSQSSHQNDDDSKDSDSHHSGGDVERRVTSPQQGAVREFPMALVVASSVAAVSILVFFCLSYIWHTRQLDRRAQKLAIRLAAEADTEINCSQCRTPASYMRDQSQDSVSDSGTEEVLQTQVQRQLDELNSLNEEEEDEGEDAEGRRRKPGGVGRTLGSRRGRGRGGRRYGSRSSRKWSGNSGGQGNRSSLVTDQEILSHFASRRHSTFFI